MKKIILLLTIAVIPAAIINAQPHTWLVYGSAGFSQNTANGNYVYPQGTNTNWNVAPGIGYQFNKHLTVGVQGSYSHTENGGGQQIPLSNFNNYNYYGGTTIDWTAGAFFRYSQKLGKIFFLYGQVNMAYMSSQAHDVPGVYYVNGSALVAYEANPPAANGFQAQIFPAVGANIYKGLALNFGLGGINYNTISQNIEGAGNSNSSNIQLTFGQQVNIGISDNFNCHMMHKHKHHHSDAVSGSEYRHVDNGGKEEDDAPAPVESKKHRKHKTEKTEDNN
ncbi:MAG: hypothetical protein P4L41_03310 [Flavipsychrobacter sp.]|nr:hypothetical protein [Flavipsychrobacter sp.]